jgi:DNA-binding transcriptional MerR regulator/effector-binding domain-containing protein
MVNIGDFARNGRVSVRMLRHYDAIGLLRPARVDPATGYRFYETGQLARLNRIVALKDLGFTLEQVRSVLDEKVGVEELRGMLRLRRAQLQEQIATDTTRLAQVEARLQMIEREGAMSTDEVEIKRVPAVRLAAVSGPVASFEPESITPVLGPLFDELMRRLGEAAVEPVGPPVAFYVDAAQGDGLVAHACAPVADGVTVDGCAVLELPAVDAATIVHRGPMDGVMPTVQTLARWIEAHGYRSTGYNREVYHHYAQGEPSGWRTELQEPVTAR